MLGNLAGQAVACALELTDQLVQWESCSEEWVFRFKEWPEGAYDGRRVLPNAQHVAATALRFPQDATMDVTMTRDGFVIVPRKPLFGPLIHKMGFYGHAQVSDGDVCVVGQYRISDGWIAIYTALNLVILTIAWFLPLPYIMHEVVEKGAGYADLMTRPGEIMALVLFVSLVVFVLSLMAGSVILFIRTRGFINRTLNLPERHRVQQFLEGLALQAPWELADVSYELSG